MRLSTESINFLLEKSKIHVSSSEESAQIQHKLFELGCYWFREIANEYKNPRCLDAPYLYIDEHKRLRYGTDNRYFENDLYKELFPNDILSLIEDKDEFLEII